MKELLNDNIKFGRLEIPPDKYLNFVINSQDKIKNIPKSLHIKRVLLICYIRKFCLLDDVLGFYMTKLRYTHLSLTIVHLLDLHLMLLTHLPSNKLAKFLVPISSPLTINEHTAKDCCVWHLLKKLLRLIVNMSWLV